MKHRITGVDPGSPAEKAGIRPGWYLTAIDGQNVYDVIDYEQLTAQSRISVTVLEAPAADPAESEISESWQQGAEHGGTAELPPAAGAKEHTFRIRKDEYEPLGLGFASGLMSPVRQCANHCIFCFIDQMPHGNRKTLYFKDDDWRLSLIMGNYVTLTNVSEREFERILARRAAPLYITVHATDGEVRSRMMRSKNAENLLPRLKRLAEADLGFHCQIVLCPEINDSAVLEKTLSDLFELRPACRSVAVVPLGLTKHREGLEKLTPITPERAKECIKQIDEFKKRHGVTDFCYASDEMYLTAGLSLPPYEAYGDFEQIENGVGLYRLFEHDFLLMLDAVEKQPSLVEFDSVSGVSIAPLMQALFDKLLPFNVKINVHPVVNDFFGHTVTVTGLTTARDILTQWSGKMRGRALLLPHTMLRENDTVFLDGLRIADVSAALGMPVYKVSAGDGADFIDELNEILASLR